MSTLATVAACVIRFIQLLFSWSNDPVCWKLSAISSVKWSTISFKVTSFFFASLIITGIIAISNYKVNLIFFVYLTILHSLSLGSMSMLEAAMAISGGAAGYYAIQMTAYDCEFAYVTELNYPSTQVAAPTKNPTIWDFAYALKMWCLITVNSSVNALLGSYQISLLGMDAPKG